MSDYVPQHGGGSGAPKKQTGAEQKKNNKLILYICLGIAVVVFVVAAVLFIKGSVTPNTDNGQAADNSVYISAFKGKWDVDKITSYEFDGAGKGVMHTAIDDYDFSYTADSAKLYVDFVSQDADDTQYTYRINGNDLVLTRWGVEYAMTKVSG